MAEPMTTLQPELQAFLQSPNMVLVTSLDAATKDPSNHLITWVLAVDERTIRLAADARGRLMQNLRADGRVLLTIMTAGSVFSISGEARVIQDQLEGPSLKLAMAEVAVNGVQDIMFWGGQLAVPPAARVTYDAALKEKLDTAVLAAMRA